jgi:hypothetical protein
VRQRISGKPSLFTQYRDALADNFADTAAWRRKRRPPDERHLRAAAALDAAAGYTSFLYPCERLAPYVGLWRTPLGSDPWELLDIPLHSAKKFCFGKNAGEPTADAVDHLIAETFWDLLERWKQHLPTDRLAARIEDGRVPFPTHRADVVEYFARRGRNLYRAMTGRELPR